MSVSVLVKGGNRLVWKDGDWAHVIEPEGRMWRWHGVYDSPEEARPAEHNYGLIPGGAFVALERPLRYAGGTGVDPDGGGA
jgi:hypothetical protein